MGRPIAHALAGLALLVSGSAEAGANALQNADFDQDLAGWSNPFDLPAAWSPLDSDGRADSGSALLTNETSPGNGGVQLVLRQCFDVVPGQRIGLAGDLYLPDPSPPNTEAALVVWLHGLSGCNGATLDSLWLSAFTTGSWQRLEGSIVAGPGSASVALYLGVSKYNDVTDDTVAQFDALFLDVSGVFGDGFES